MKRRDFLVSSMLGTAAVGAGFGQVEVNASERQTGGAPGAKRRILIAGGGFDTAFIRYMATLSGKPRPRICYLPTASADSASGIISWHRSCAPLNVEALVQESFIASSRQTHGWDEVLPRWTASCARAATHSISRPSGRLKASMPCFARRGTAGFSPAARARGSLCWFEEGTTDSRPKELTTVQCLGFPGAPLPAPRS